MCTAKLEYSTVLCCIVLEVTCEAVKTRALRGKPWSVCAVLCRAVPFSACCVVLYCAVRAAILPAALVARFLGPSSSCAACRAVMCAAPLNARFFTEVVLAGNSLTEGRDVDNVPESAMFRSIWKPAHAHLASAVVWSPRKQVRLAPLRNIRP